MPLNEGWIVRSEKGEGWAGRTADPLTRHELDCRKVGTRRAQRGWEPRYFAKNLDRELRPSALSLDALPRRRLEREAPRNVASNRRAENAARHSVEGRGGSGWRVRSQWVVPVSEVVNTGAAEGRGRQSRPVRGAKCLVLGAKEEFEIPYSGPEPRRCLQPSGGASGAKRETLEHCLAALWWLKYAKREEGGVMRRR